MLDLSYCKNISDVSMLRKVKKLNLRYCESITDISMLRNI